MAYSEENNSIHILIKKYMSNELTHEERLQLAKYIDGLSSDELKELPIVKVEDFDSSLTLSEEASKRILSNILRPAYPAKLQLAHRRFYVRVLSIAASLLIAVAAGLYFYHLNITSKPSEVVIARAVTLPTTTPTSFNRHIKLVDGSTVILKAGSTLSVDKGFLGSTREVSLSGEAFFDVKHIDDKPFIIHTGSVKTTVLGTAFDIKADSKNVVVSVTRGLVRVDRGKNTLAVLGVADKVQCSMKSADVIVERSKASGNVSVLTWTKQGLTFDHVSMLNVVRQLSQRYGVNITIPNHEIADTPLFISFDGTESISDVMNVICNMLPDMSYRMAGKNIVITQK
jgi:ferric-dicitrate binding protein FerR (iron transport regulator)